MSCLVDECRVSLTQKLGGLTLTTALDCGTGCFSVGSHCHYLAQDVQCASRGKADQDSGLRILKVMHLKTCVMSPHLCGLWMFLHKTNSNTVFVFVRSNIMTLALNKEAGHTQHLKVQCKQGTRFVHSVTISLFCLQTTIKPHDCLKI